MINYKPPNGYLCNSCNGYNDLTSNPCVYCKAYISDNEFHAISNLTRLKRSGEHYPMATEMIELFHKFFNAEKVQISTLTDIEMHERREELRMVAFKAKAMLTAHDEEERARNANRTKEQKNWLLSSTSNDPNVTDAIRDVKERKARMSKADKLAMTLKSLGVSGSDAIVAQVIKNETGSAVSSSSSRTIMDKREIERKITDACKAQQHHNCNGIIDTGFRKEDKPCNCKCHKPKVIFNPASLVLRK